MRINRIGGRLHSGHTLPLGIRRFCPLKKEVIVELGGFFGWSVIGDTSDESATF